MKRLQVSYLLVLLTLAVAASAQMDASDGENPPKRIFSPSPDAGRIFVSGRVLIADGSPLPALAEVQTVCNGQKLTRARTDSHGGFSFALTNDYAGQTQSAASGSDDSWGGIMAPRGGDSNWQGCELEAVLAGFTSQRVQLTVRANRLDQKSAEIVLHRITPVEGLTISVTSAQAPENARDAFQKGMEQERKSKWEDAQAWFEKAVQIYPRYAVAWFELGRVWTQKNDNNQSKRCWQQALGADPKYEPPYQMLAQLAVGQNHWQELAEVTGKWLALDTEFTDAWFLDAVGNYFVGNFVNAEKSARQGIKLDQAHHIPKLQYLLGMILMQRKAYAEATEHMQLYLHLVSKSADVNEAHKQLVEIERLSASAIR